MKTIILCGGRGTRLQEETEYRPKPLVPIGGRPILYHIMKLYAHHGFKDFILCLGYRGNMIKEYFINYELMNNDFTICLGKKDNITYRDKNDEKDFCVTLADTGQETMTGGRLKRVKRYIDDENFMLTYGDGVSDLNIKSIVEFHMKHGKLATITTVRPVSRFGVVNIDKNNNVIDFMEKPQLHGWISVGFFVFNRKIFNYLKGDKCILEQAPLKKLVNEKQLMAYRHKGFFFAMDTYREYLYLNELWDKKKAPWRVWK